MLISLSNTPREYSWGSPTLIPELEGRTPTGRPEAEIWYGDHPGCPSVTDDGRALGDVLAAEGAPALPFLLKILAAGMSLSIQAHPSKPEAVEGFAREEAAGVPRDADARTYRDDNHKPEIIVALSDRFRALVGLRPLAATRRLLSALGDGDAVAALARRLEGEDEARALRDALGWVLAEASREDVDGVIATFAGARSDEFAAELEVLRTIAADFPGDPGVLVALLMNLVELGRGEALFAPAGVLHAYQEGLGVELMAASDNVLRGGLTPKHVDVAELLRIVETTPAPAPIVTPVVVEGVEVYDAGVPDFSLLRVRVETGEERAIAVNGPTIVLVTSGEVAVSSPSGRVDLGAGRAAYAGPEEREVRLTGAGDVFVAQPGTR